MNHGFVAREAELERLHATLNAAVNGSGQVLFISGEAGSGKTALFHEFARQARLIHPGLGVISGLCDSQTDVQTPYAPFREIMTGLAALGDTAISKPVRGEAQPKISGVFGLFTDAVMEFGPDLIGIFIPGASLMAKVGKFAVEQAGLVDKLKAQVARKETKSASPGGTGLTQDQLFEQYINVIRAVSQKVPLLLLVDDLHWADTASIDLLFRLCRRLEGMRVFLVGTYRPVEILAGRSGDRHPLEKTLNEIRRYKGNVWLDLNSTRSGQDGDFVDAYLNILPSRFGRDFRDALLRHTEGHPLFTVELLHDLRDRGMVRIDTDGYWVLDGPIRWEKLPARVEGVIAERIQSLGADLRENLLVASVEGEAFTAEVIARVRSQEMREVVRRLSNELEKLHQLIEGVGVQRVGEQRISRYHFAHHLVKQYIYAETDPVERSYMHESVGMALEELYAEQVDVIADQLAHHFDLAEMPAKAARYYLAAGTHAAGGFANEQALAFYQRALELTPAPAHPERFSILWQRERVYDLLGRRAEQQADLEEMSRLLGLLPADARRAAELVLRKARRALDMSQYPLVLSIVSDVIQALRSTDPESAQLIIEGYLLKARALDLLGNRDGSRDMLGTALKLAREHSLEEAECKALEQLGTVCWSAGDYDCARGYLEESLQLARSLGLIRREWSILNNLGVAANSIKEYADASRYYTTALELVHKIGSRMGEMILFNNLGEIELYRHSYQAAAGHTRNALRLADDLENKFARGIILINLGEAYREMGDLVTAGQYSQEALDELSSVNYSLGLAIVLQNLARIDMSKGQNEAALEKARRAVDIARETGSIENEVSGLVVQGGVLAQMGNVEDATRTYEQALEKSGSHPDPAQAQAAKAGIIWIACSQNITTQTFPIQTTLTNLMAETGLGEGKPLAEDFPLAVLWPVLRVLQVTADPRRGAVEQAARVLVEGRAARISDPALVHSYLSIPEHAALISGQAPDQSRQ